MVFNELTDIYFDKNIQLYQTLVRQKYTNYNLLISLLLLMFNDTYININPDIANNYSSIMFQTWFLKITFHKSSLNVHVSCPRGFITIHARMFNLNSYHTSLKFLTHSHTPALSLFFFSRIFLIKSFYPSRTLEIYHFSRYVKTVN